MKSAAFVLALGVLSAQRPDQTILQSTTRLVQVNVIVHDKNGPVADLTKDDFLLHDGKKQRRIASFSVETSNTTLNGDQARLPTNVFTNTIEHRAETPASITVLLLDGLNTRVEDQAYAKKQLTRFLGTLKPQDHVAIYALGRSLRILHDFTSDPQQLARMIAKYRPAAEMETRPEVFERPTSIPTGPDAIDAELDQLLANMNQAIADSAQVNRVRLTTQAIEAIAQHLVALPGRKNLVWLSSSFPLTFGISLDEANINNRTRDRGTFGEEIRRASMALNQANVAIYPVDARGLLAGVPSPRSSAGLIRAGLPSNAGSSPLDATTRGGHDTMEELASRTGGRAFYNTNDIAGAIRRAIDDTQVTYTLGFYPDTSELDGKYHEIKVQVPARKGLNIRSRMGYYAFETKVPSEAERKQQLASSFWSPLESTRIGVSVQVTRTSDPEPDVLKLDLMVNARGLLLVPKDDRLQGAIAIVIAQMDAESKMLDLSTDPIKLSLRRESLPQYMELGMPFAKAIKAKSGLSQLRIVVVDRDTGALGSVIVPMARVPAS